MKARNNTDGFRLKAGMTPAILLITLGAIGRLVPHAPNFTPIAALALFGGLYLPKKWALILPLLAMFISDIFIGFYFWPIMLAVYAGFAITVFIGARVRQNKKFRTILGGTLLGSIIFFALTNWAVWAFGSMYPHNLAGLFQSYYMAIPFFRNSVAGDLFFVFILIGGMELIPTLLPSRSARSA